MFQSAIHGVFLMGMLYLSFAVQYNALFLCHIISMMHNQTNTPQLSYVILFYRGGGSTELKMNL